ncbi:MAG: CsbD family protein [Verrucomicrobia bacterium]|nr:CsbD family protein [Verrucomicrobiota bacterium]MBV9885078.1 CsbD family protein [Acidobacteriota bacterium]
MNSGNTDKIKGAAHEAKGKVKEIAGKATGDKALQGHGTAEKLGGKAQEKVGDVKKALGK